MIQFYSPDIEKTLTLPEEESGHCVRVLRMREGEEIRVTDGKGNIYYCKITEANHRQVALEILRKESKPHRGYEIILAIAPTKNSDRLERMVEKATEIGVDKIVLLKCQRSERKNQRIDRLNRIIISAMNQSLDSYLPKLQDITPLKEFVSNQSSNFQKFFGYCDKNYPLKNFSQECEASKSVVIMIGPEGDFSPEEVEMSVAHGFVPVTFGNKRLRTETAGVYALCAINVLNEL
ncbi:MAG: 16S rRNA (uracil(1498)-N(3))-methyltransferase [Muribaculaceae bacterium]|nr:16S rRNA (uracil(1498)-N(3))-methyltransferase [Muribaculaceae bacterium]